jgi:hypothetical protein
MSRTTIRGNVRGNPIDTGTVIVIVILGISRLAFTYSTLCCVVVTLLLCYCCVVV